jgi:Amt family ammonium transporter
MFNAELPRLTHMLFQGMFFIITPAIICGAFAERMKFSSMALFSALWGVLVYCPLAHSVWGGGCLAFGTGIMGGALDFAGGTVVHISSGVTALVAALVIGPRLGHRQEPMPPHNLPFTLLGTGILWFGWFGFNAGSALAANGVAAQAFLNTFVAAAAAMIGWLIAERMKDGHATTLGAASGAVAGLVAITPCAGFVGGLAAVVIGLLTGAICFLAIGLKFRFGFDDSLDVIAVHLVGGIFGSVVLGLFADASVNPAGKDGVFFGGGWHLFGEQALAVAVVFVFSFVVSGLIGVALKAVLPKGIRVSEEEEATGLDLTQHAESAYSLDRA